MDPTANTNNLASSDASSAPATFGTASPPPGGTNSSDAPPVVNQTGYGETIPEVPQAQVSTPTNSGQQSGSSSGSEPAKKKRRNVILVALAIFLMLGGIGAGTFLVRNQQFNQSFAWDCSLYTFSVSQNGEVAAVNGSTRDEPAQNAEVYIDGNLVDTLTVPALDSGDGATIGTVSVPGNGQFSWQVVGTKDCQDTGNYAAQIETASCSAVKAYDEEWNELSLLELRDLEEGDVVRFAVSGTASAGQFSMARFTVNGELRDEVTQTSPTGEFYDEYTIPDGVTNFSVTGEIYHSEAGWI